MWNLQIFSKKILYSIIVILLVNSGIISGSPNSQSIQRRTNAIDKLRKLAPEIISAHEFYATDNFLIRWLEAKDFNVAAANQMLKKAFKWRKENKIDAPVNETLTDFTSPSPLLFEGHDKEGHPTEFVALGNIDLRRFAITGHRTKALRFFDQVLERGFEKVRSKKQYLSINQYVILFDFSGMNVRQHLCIQCLSIHMEIVYHGENYYPGAVKYFILLNMNRAALQLLEMVRPVMSASTKKSLRLFDTNKSEWSKFLLSLISPDQLPRQYIS